MPPPIFVIENAIPIPPKKKPEIYPFEGLKVNQSFFAPLSHKAKISARASYYGKQQNKSFVIRSMDGGVRVWRIK